ncbi:glycosidase [candidate division KSB1 bacterium]|nr:glycosidase [candidate division KSB1 bacterium]
MTDMANRVVDFGDGRRIEVNINKPVARYPGNPIITAQDVNQAWRDPAHQVTTIHNAGINILNGKTVMLFRSHLRCGMSVLGMAKSKNGVDNWELSPGPALKPATKQDTFVDGVDVETLIENETGGLEDARITKFGDEYAISYSAYHAMVEDRVRVSLITTKDFNSFTRHGPILNLDMRNVVLFSEKINNKYTALFRPNDVSPDETGGKYTQIRIGYSDDWKSNVWELPETPIMQTGFGPSAFSNKIGPCAPPIKTAKGWLNIFHGVRTTMDGNPYVLGVALHDLNDPASIKMSSIPILFPSRADCKIETDRYIHVPNVVFCCGAAGRENGSILIYYGGNDTVMNVGITHEDVLVALCEHYAQDALTGRLLYSI